MSQTPPLLSSPWGPTVDHLAPAPDDQAPPVLTLDGTAKERLPVREAWGHLDPALSSHSLAVAGALPDGPWRTFMHRLIDPDDAVIPPWIQNAIDRAQLAGARSLPTLTEMQCMPVIDLVTGRLPTCCLEMFLLYNAVFDQGDLLYRLTSQHSLGSLERAATTTTGPDGASILPGDVAGPILARFADDVAAVQRRGAQRFGAPGQPRLLTAVCSMLGAAQGIDSNFVVPPLPKHTIYTNVDAERRCWGTQSTVASVLNTRVAAARRSVLRGLTTVCNTLHGWMYRALSLALSPACNVIVIRTELVACYTPTNDGDTIPVAASDTCDRSVHVLSCHGDARANATLVLLDLGGAAVEVLAALPAGDPLVEGVWDLPAYQNTVFVPGVGFDNLRDLTVSSSDVLTTTEINPNRLGQALLMLGLADNHVADIGYHFCMPTTVLRVTMPGLATEPMELAQSPLVNHVEAFHDTRVPCSTGDHIHLAGATTPSWHVYRELDRVRHERAQLKQWLSEVGAGAVDKIVAAFFITSVSTPYLLHQEAKMMRMAMQTASGDRAAAMAHAAATLALKVDALVARGTPVAGVAALEMSAVRDELQIARGDWRRALVDHYGARLAMLPSTPVDSFVAPSADSLVGTMFGDGPHALNAVDPDAVSQPSHALPQAMDTQPEAVHMTLTTPEPVIPAADEEADLGQPAPAEPAPAPAEPTPAPAEPTPAPAEPAPAPAPAEPAPEDDPELLRLQLQYGSRRSDRRRVEAATPPGMVSGDMADLAISPPSSLPSPTDAGAETDTAAATAATEKKKKKMGPVQKARMAMAKTARRRKAQFWRNVTAGAPKAKRNKQMDPLPPKHPMADLHATVVNGINYALWDAAMPLLQKTDHKGITLFQLLRIMGTWQTHGGSPLQPNAIEFTGPFDAGTVVPHTRKELRLVGNRASPRGMTRQPIGIDDPMGLVCFPVPFAYAGNDGYVTFGCVAACAYVSLNPGKDIIFVLPNAGTMSLMHVWSRRTLADDVDLTEFGQGVAWPGMVTREGTPARLHENVGLPLHRRPLWVSETQPALPFMAFYMRAVLGDARVAAMASVKMTEVAEAAEQLVRDGLQLLSNPSTPLSRKPAPTPPALGDDPLPSLKAHVPLWRPSDVTQGTCLAV